MHTILCFPHSPPTVRAELSVQAGEKLIFSANTLLLCKHTVIPTIGRRASCQFMPDSGLILIVNNDWRAGHLSYYPHLLCLKFGTIRRHLKPFYLLEQSDMLVCISPLASSS